MTGNLFAAIPRDTADEFIEQLAAFGTLRVERIVSTGQASPRGYWYDQDEWEFVLLVSGSATLLFEGEAEPRVLGPGDWLEIPPHVRHRVDRTDSDEPTVWLAILAEAPEQPD